MSTRAFYFWTTFQLPVLGTHPWEIFLPRTQTSIHAPCRGYSRECVLQVLWPSFSLCLFPSCPLSLTIVFTIHLQRHNCFIRAVTYFLDHQPCPSPTGHQNHHSCSAMLLALTDTLYKIMIIVGYSVACLSATQRHELLLQYEQQQATTITTTTTHGAVDIQMRCFARLVTWATVFLFSRSSRPCLELTSFQAASN